MTIELTPYFDSDGIIIYHGDSAEVLGRLPRVQMLLTDPPYGLGRADDYASLGGTPEFNERKGHYRGKSYAPIVGDTTPFDPRHLLGIADKTVIWGADHFSHLLPVSRGWLIWDKRDGLGSNMLSDAELAWTDIATPTRIFRHKWLGYMRASEVGFHVHPTQKPVALMRWILEKWTEPGDLVFDPYMGSGPIAQACRDLGRRYIGVEIVEEYCAVAVGRLSQGVLAL